MGHAMLSDINVSHGSVATPLRFGGICNDDFIANILPSVTVKEFWKSVIIWQSYGQEFGVLFLLDHGVDWYVNLFCSPFPLDPHIWSAFYDASLRFLSRARL